MNPRPPAANGQRCSPPSSSPTKEGGEAAILAVSNLSKRYGDTQALAGVTFSLRRGEILAVAGENGAGKSTLVRSLSGVVTPDSGEILFQNQSILGTDVATRRLLGISLAPQELTLCPDLSVVENIGMGALPRMSFGRVDWDTARQRAEHRLTQLGLEIDVSRMVGSLSVAEQAFVQIARALTDETKVLIADEPTAPLGGEMVDMLLNLLRRVATQGTAVIYISHRLPEVVDLCESAIVMRDGAIVSRLESGIALEDLVVAMVGKTTDAPIVDVEARPVGAPRLSCSNLRGALVRDVSLEVGAGEIVAVYGLLGSGREELGQLISGATSPQFGSVEVDGRTLNTGRIRDAIAAGLGYVPAERRSQGLALGQSIRANLAVASLGAIATRGVVNSSQETDLVLEWITRLGIVAPSMDAEVGTLSGGNQQKVLIARWLAAGSEVLVFEEPTRGVDVGTRAAIYRLLEEQAREGKAILIISSDIEEVATLGQRVIVLRDGVVCGQLGSTTAAEIAHLALLGQTEATQ